MQINSNDRILAAQAPAVAATSGVREMPQLLSTARPQRGEPIIRLPALGLSVRVRLPFLRSAYQLTVIETTNATGLGPPLHRRAEAEIFEIVSGRFLFDVDGKRFIARRGDLVRVPGGAARAFVNVTGTGARQQVIMEPGFDAVAFFLELRTLLNAGLPGPEATRCFTQRWGIEVLGPPLDAASASASH